MGLNTLLAHLVWDQKGRHQVAMIATTTPPKDKDKDKHETMTDSLVGQFWFRLDAICYVRACNGHGIPGLDYRRIGNAITPQNALMVSALSHSTGTAVWEIMAKGLIPQATQFQGRGPQWRSQGKGRGKGSGERQVICMSAFLPWDSRYTKGVRVENATCTIILDHLAISELPFDDADFCYLTVSQNGVIECASRISPRFIERVIHHPNGVRALPRRVIYDTRLAGAEVLSFAGGDASVAVGKEEN